MEVKDDLIYIRNGIDLISRTIPNFIDTKIREHKNIFSVMCKIFGLFKICVQTMQLSDKGIPDLSTEYYAYLLHIYNLDREIYRDVVGYLDESYDFIMEEMEERNMYESCYNLYHMYNLYDNLRYEE